eukprot:TRINITY_DN95378_c0_g1_i1.p1 TRINITY_DN95378_c0_g1~~TRINITY_DN95378_c0_g1_i1.p1  ORF type:complete len:287 (+),score=43.44 TRINITY_DN95378_c0_g1_i1:48-908(+)
MHLMTIAALIFGLLAPLLRADGPVPTTTTATTIAASASTTTTCTTSEIVPEPVAYPSARCKISGLEEPLNGIYDFVKMTAGFQSFQHQENDYKLYALSEPKFAGVPHYWILSSSWGSSYLEAKTVFWVEPNRKTYLSDADGLVQDYYTCTDSSANCICTKGKTDGGHCGGPPGCWQESSRAQCLAHDDRWLADECYPGFSMSCFTDCFTEHDMHYFCSWEELAITPSSSCSDGAFQFGVEPLRGRDCPFDPTQQKCRSDGSVSWANINAISITLVTACISNLYLLS